MSVIALRNQLTWQLPPAPGCFRGPKSQHPSPCSSSQPCQRAEGFGQPPKPSSQSWSLSPAVSPSHAPHPVQAVQLTRAGLCGGDGGGDDGGRGGFLAFF